MKWTKRKSFAVEEKRKRQTAKEGAASLLQPVCSGRREAMIHRLRGEQGQRKSDGLRTFFHCRCQEQLEKRVDDRKRERRAWLNTDCRTNNIGVPHLASALSSSAICLAVMSTLRVCVGAPLTGCVCFQCRCHTNEGSEAHIFLCVCEIFWVEAVIKPLCSGAYFVENTFFTL